MRKVCLCRGMAISSPLQEVSGFLESYWNRTQVFRTLQFGSTLVSGLLEGVHPDAASSVLRVANSISNMRVMLRLLDDIPVLAHTISNWKRRKGESAVTLVADVVSVFSSQLYYPLEHLAWAADNHLLPCIQSHWLWTVDVILWGVSLLVSCLQAVARIQSISRELKELGIRSPSSVSSEGSATAGLKRRVTFEDQRTASTKTRIRVLRHQRFAATLTVIETLSDLMNAVHWMPQGFLWAGKLTNVWVGLFGTVSSLIGLFKVLPVRPSLTI